MTAVQTPAAPSATRVSHALNAMLATGLAAIGIAAVGYRVAIGEASPGNPYVIIAGGCAVLLACTALAEFGFHTAHRWARAATCVAWLGAWPVLFVALTLMVVDGAAATMAFASCIGACSVGMTAVGERTTSPR
ncbi:MAG: hypothetical protein ACRDO7_01055 [Nocardioidaceae bacterium]